MTEPLYSALSPNLLAQFARQNTPHGLFGAGTWRAPAAPNAAEPTQQGGRYGAQLSAPRPSYSSAQAADLPSIVNAPNVSQEQALAALQALANAPTPNPVAASGGLASPSTPGLPGAAAPAGQGFGGILDALGGGQGGQFPWTPPPGQAPAPNPTPTPEAPAYTEADVLNYYDQIRNLPGRRGGGQSGNIGDYRLWDVNKNGNYLVLDAANNPVFGSADNLQSRTDVARWLAEQNAVGAP